MRITYKRQFGELFIYFLSIALLCILLAVSPSRKKASYAALGEKLQPGQEFVANHWQVLADFEHNSVAFDSLSAEATFRLAQNPAPSAVNSSAVCGQILGNGGAFDLYSEQLDYYVDLSRESDLQMRVYTSVKGKLTFTWLGKDAMGAPLPALTGIMNIDKTNEWVKVACRFEAYRAGGKKSGAENKWVNTNKGRGIFSGYQHFKVHFEPAAKQGASLRFFLDEIQCTAMHAVPALFKSLASGPVIPVKPNSWYEMHVANVSILTPAQTGERRWQLYLRGTHMYKDGKHDDIGVFYQDTAGFQLAGPWQDDPANPVLKHGRKGDYDYKTVLDGSVVQAPDKTIYLYYKGKYGPNTGSLNVAYSKDGRNFTKFSGNPIKKNSGPNDIIYWKGQYYLFFGHKNQIWVTISASPLHFDGPSIPIIQTGQKGGFDGYAVNGAKVFQIPGDDRWFLIYQCSDRHKDYPERIHAAWSNDLVHWKKVKSAEPLFKRGSAGNWDQGAIWTGDVIVFKDSLYMFYEGWGRAGAVQDRNVDYFKGGCSQVGLASVSAYDFKKWCGEE